jgi:DNA-binding NtrC family response regulator
MLAPAETGMETPMVEPKPLVLSVDDDPHLLRLIAHQVTGWGYAHAGAVNAAQMRDKLDEMSPAVILLDITLEDADGTDLAGELHRRLPSVPIIMITAHGTIEAAVKCLKNGAYDFLCKPLDFERLRIEIDKAVERNRLILQVKAFEDATRRSDFHGMVGRSDEMRGIYRLIETVAPTDAAVLILGETGTGKELAARAIHECSTRSEGPFVAVNAPAIPHELIESALFGHEKGAFTGAYQKHIGYCEQADGGTLFLDEICEMDYNVQAKLLRFLQDHVVQPVGAKTGRAVAVRVIAATNRDPKIQIEERRLREDFYYRLSVITLHLAPLRRRPGDIALLARYFLGLGTGRYGRTMSSIAPEAVGFLEGFSWPGNVRQLEHVINQVVIMNPGDELKAGMLPAEIREASPAVVRAAHHLAADMPGSVPTIQEMERQLILGALQKTAGSVPDAAKRLGLSPATLYRKVKKFGISRAWLETEGRTVSQ